MKKSPIIQLALDAEDNDIKGFALKCKLLRERRSEKFIEDWLPVFELRYPIQLRGNVAYCIYTQSHGIIDYYPKANKILIRKTNDWIKPGLAWMIKHLTEDSEDDITPEEKTTWSKQEVIELLYKHTEMMLAGYASSLDQWIKENV